MLGYAKLFRERVYAEGKAEGIVEGKAEGKAEGIAEGKAEGKAEGIAEGIAEGRKELFNALLEAQRQGIPLEKVLETYAAENGIKTNGTDTAPND